jgi:hypothetical protein
MPEQAYLLEGGMSHNQYMSFSLERAAVVHSSTFQDAFPSSEL